jgi:heme oxygenase
MIMDSLPGNIKEKCPAFKDGCPFKETDSVDTLYNNLKDMPTTHHPNQGNAAATAVEESLRLVHTKSVELKSQFSNACPVFATSCPFKTITTYGSPLISELDGIVQRGVQMETVAMDPEAIAAMDPDDLPSEPLSKSLKSGTKIVHRSAENVHFVRDFLNGSVKKESYIELLRAFYHVYHTLEGALRNLPRQLTHCDFTVLERASTIEADLRYYLGTPDGEVIDFGSPSPAAQQYVDQINLLAKEDPLMLLAHAYTRYLGDLSGGQILAKTARKAYGLTADEGVSFYNFEGVGMRPTDLKAFKKAYRSSLDALQLSASRADALVQEANKAFLMNILLFEERDVAAGHLERTRTLEEIQQIIEENVSPLQFQRAYGKNQPQAVTQCPFIPGPPGQRKAGEPSFHGVGKACPWPFIWFHDPKSAIVTHPVKNTVGFVTMLGLFRVAWEYPRRSLVVFLATAVALPWMKPRGKDSKK